MACPQIFTILLEGQGKIGEQLELIDPMIYKFCWIVDYPMFEFDDESKGYQFSHNPFSMPQGGLESLTQEIHLMYWHTNMILCVTE